MENSTFKPSDIFNHVYESLVFEDLKLTSDQACHPSLKADVQRRMAAQLYYAVNSGKTNEDPLVLLGFYHKHLSDYYTTVDAEEPTGLNSYVKSTTQSSSNVDRSNWSLKDLRSNSIFQKLEKEANSQSQRSTIDIEGYERALDSVRSLQLSKPEDRKPQMSHVTKLKPSPENELKLKPPVVKMQQPTNSFIARPFVTSERKLEESNKIFPSGNASVKITHSTEKKREEVKSSAFCTAKEQLIVDQRKKNSNNNNGASNVPNYGGARPKSLGPRRGLNSPFILPIKDSKQNENDGSGVEKNVNEKGENDKITDERLKNIEPKMIELIENEIMDNGAPVNWDDIAGLEFAKKTIKEIVVWPMLRPDIFTGLRGPPRGILLFGPPGTGKTLIGKCIASQSRSTFFSISASSLTSKWVGEGEKMVRALFAVARVNQPSVIFIDEIDSLLSQRSDSEHESSRRIKTEFLVQLDGATTSQEDRLLVVGATNRPQELDEAARRRLVKRLYIPLPEFAARKQIINLLMAEQRHVLTERQIDVICDRTDGYSCADMTNLCKEAAFGPIRSIDFGDIEHISSDEVRPITNEDFEAALCQVRASVSSQDLALYDDWNSRFGSAAK